MNLVLQKKLNEGVAENVFPDAELLCAQAGEVLWHLKTEKLTQKENQKEKYFFDLASLTKPLCTALLAMAFHEKNIISLEDKVGNFFETQTLEDITLKELLNHTSGLIDWAPLYADKISGPAPNFADNHKLILELILHDDYFFQNPGKTIYSDIGYILLGAILEKAGKEKLNQLFEKYISKKILLGDKQIFFVPLAEKKVFTTESFLPTENCPFRKRVIQGEVQDKNSFAMGGVTGHAGLFSNAATLHLLLNELRLAKLGKSALFYKETFDLFCQPDPLHNSIESVGSIRSIRSIGRDESRPYKKEPYFTLGFDTPTQGISQSGSLFSKNSIGHLGYSGTSFWWDLEKDLWIIFLTNRCMPNRKNFKIQKFRPEIHDLAFQEILKF